MTTRSKPVKGQKLYIVGRNYRKAEGSCTVISSGPKYFEVHIDGEGDYSKVKFHQDTWRENTNFTSYYSLYSSKEEYLEEQEYIRVRDYVRWFVTGTEYHKLEAEHLKKIEDIILSATKAEGEKS